MPSGRLWNASLAVQEAVRAALVEVQYPAPDDLKPRNDRVRPSRQARRPDAAEGRARHGGSRLRKRSDLSIG